MAPKTVIVTRHRAALDWIEKYHPEIVFPRGSRAHYVLNGEVERGTVVSRDMMTTSIDLSPQRIQGSHIVHVSNELVGSDEVQLISHAEPEDVAGNRVIGILPEELSILTAEYWKLSMVVPAEFRGKELTVEDMERFGCSLKRYWIYDEAGRSQLI